MSDRWVCRFCSTRNHSVNFSCQKCGQVRTMESGPQGQDEAPPRNAGRGRRWIRWVWVPIVVVGLIAFLAPADTVARDANGVIVSSGSLSVFDLREGDCFDFIDDDDATEIGMVLGLPCVLPHYHEVYRIHTLDMQGDYPSEFRFDRIFEDVCLDAFEDYVGTQWELSDVWVDMFWPTEDGWTRNGDRTVTCFLFLLEGPTVGSFRNSGS